MEKSRIAYSEILDKLFSTMSGIEADVWQSPFDVIHKNGIFRLLHYRPMVENVAPVPVLIVYAFINRPYIMDLQPDRSIVRRFLENGLNIYMIDWGYPSRIHKFLDIEDYIDYIDTSMDIVSRETSQNKVTLHGYCLGGTLSTIYAALHPEKVKNLVIQATPIKFDIEGTINLWAKHINPDKIVDALGNAPGFFLNVAFLMANPINLVYGKYVGLMEEKVDTQNFLRMEKWVFDSPDVPGEVYRRYIKEWYQQDLLIKGEFKVRGQRVNLKRIDMPLLILLGEHDHIAPPASSIPLLDAVSSSDKEVMALPVGHIGLSVSSKAHKEFWPKVCDWLKKRSQ
ncbi:MAG: class III poly(R)-hydroxyalkanoic acid synthase subunit PhaC [Candidatus Bathyarchaeota archaeon]|nr:class III poly(R)-hydroxyalkanoic acid synthase subunit PhaC [Candidatus Bathyarchaeota archaeon]